LAITAVHPLRESAVRALVDRSGGDWSVVEQLINDGLLIPTEFAGRRFYVHRLRVEDGPAEQTQVEPTADSTDRSG